MRGLLRLIIVIAVLVLLAGAGVAYAGIIQVPVLSAAFGMDHPADIGSAKPDSAGYLAWQQKYGLVHTSPDANYTLSSKHSFSGTYALDEVVPEGIILATRTIRGSTPWIRDVTINFHDGSAMAAGFLDASPYGYPVAGPVKVAFRLVSTGPKSVTVAIDSVEFGRIGVPADIVAKATDALNGYLTTRLAGIEGLKIDQLALVEAGVKFKGTLPNTFGAEPPKAGQLP